jgi:hypothetical protein
MRRLKAQAVTVNAPGKSWQVEFFDPGIGQRTGQGRLTTRGQRLRIVLPAFEGAVALKLKRLDP